MREFDALAVYPESKAPRVANRTIKNRIAACYRDREFFDGNRANGYGGLVDDGRWKAVAEFMAREYGLVRGSKVLQINAEKGFLLSEFHKLGIDSKGTEQSQYAISESDAFIREGGPVELIWPTGYFDLVIAIGTIYTLNLYDAIRCLKEIQRVGKRSFVTLGSYETLEDYWLMRSWSLLGCMILTKAEWIEVMQHAGYDGDYKCVTARSLGLVNG